MRILVDYRPALRERTGVGEYVHALAAALAADPAPDDTVTLFSASWRDRVDVASAPPLDVVDRRIPVRLLNYAWHRWRWPPIERLAGGFDVVQSLHPLLLPARRAAQVVTIHDLDFLDHPERTRGEIRRDYPRLAAAHARNADRVIAVSRHTAADVERRLGVPRDRISIASPGAPSWPARRGEPRDGVVLYVGSLEPRKNIGGLLDAYARIAAGDAHAPRLVLAGRGGEDADWRPRLARAPLAGRVDLLGYVPHESLPALYANALVLVMPSHFEGFGIPALEAMTIGVPVIASNAGALPEVMGDAGLIVDAGDPEALAGAVRRVLGDAALRETLRERGWQRARVYQWSATARATRDAWVLAREARVRRG